MSKIDRTPKPLPALTDSEIALFWSKVPDRPEGACWVWNGRIANGYGYLGLGPTIPSRGYGRSQFGAHRISYFLANGIDPEPLHALHKCDNPPCVNPDHLFLGTQADNDRDKEAKGRGSQAHGEDCGNVKLSAEDVAEIRRRYVPYKVGYPQLSREFGVHAIHIAAIVKGRAWRRNYIPSNPKPLVPIKTKKINTAKLTASEVLEIKGKYLTGRVSQRTLAAEYGVSQGAIKPIVMGKTWRHLSTDYKDSGECTP